ncbi:60S ribosomal protein L28-1 [Mycena venus]|uniref:60S ribosomal protein L28-1 n=1 Tax=Mycena venus TaxID=2733690 RepID=A0A8H6XSB0_9AGAR|nr:60S ribosomal protein L28-1 [Mycena venus]
MSTGLQWLLVRINSPFIAKRDTSVGQVFPKENGILRNLHSHQFSGLANAKTVHIADPGNSCLTSRRRPPMPFRAQRPRTSSAHGQAPAAYLASLPLSPPRTPAAPTSAPLPAPVFRPSLRPRRSVKRCRQRNRGPRKRKPLPLQETKFLLSGDVPGSRYAWAHRMGFRTTAVVLTKVYLVPRGQTGLLMGLGANMIDHCLLLDTRWLGFDPRVLYPA